MKRAMTWVDIDIWLAENAGNIVNGYIDNIYGDSDRLILRIRRSRGEPISLAIMPGEALYITNRAIERRGDALPHVITLFRRYLRDSAINSLSHKPCERIVEMNVIKSEGGYRLIAELIPRGVIAVVDSSDVVKIVSRRLVARDREVRIGSRYVYPPQQPGICNEDLSRLSERVMRGYDIVRGIITGANIPPDVAEEAIYRLGIKKDLRPTDLGASFIRSVLEGVVDFILSVKKSPVPGIVLDQSGSLYGFYPFEPKHLISLGYVFRRFPSFNEAIDTFYSQIEVTKALQKSPELSRIEKSIEKLRSQIIDAEEKLKAMRRILEYINQNYQILEDLFECAKRRSSMCVNTLDNTISSISNGSLELKIEGYKYRLDPRLSFMENYFEIKKRISELEKRISRGSEEIARLQEEAKRVHADIERRRVISTIRTLRRREWFERYHWIITSEGLLAIGGMDADQNERIVKKYLRDDYIFLHADIQGGSAVILFTDREYTFRSIEEAARIAACYSRAWQAGYGSIDVFYVKGSQVSKSPPPGQYLEKGSFMIYGEKGWVKKVPLELAVGVEILSETIPRIIVGPQELVSSKASNLCVVIPGDIGRRDAAEHILRKWIESSGARREILEAIDVDEIVKRLPGKVRIRFPSNKRF